MFNIVEYFKKLKTIQDNIYEYLKHYEKKIELTTL